MPNPTFTPTASSYSGEFAGKYLAASLLTAKTLDDAKQLAMLFNYWVARKNRNREMEES